MSSSQPNTLNVDGMSGISSSSSSNTAADTDNINMTTNDVTAASTAADAADNELRSLLLPSLECSLCLSLVCEPISTSCGHTFCRVCLVKSLRRHKKRCPSCREVCHLVAENALENVMIKSIAIQLDRDTYMSRLEEAKQEKASWTTLYPIFYYNSTIFPGNILSLHLFEPRYKLMMQRVVNTTNAFAYVPNFSNYCANIGDIALVAKVKEAEFLPDGRCLMEAVIVSRNKIVDHYVEDGTQGLHFCRVESFKDDALPVEERPEVDQLAQRCRELVNQLFEYVGNQRAIEGQYGPMPPANGDHESLSLWATSLSPLSSIHKIELLRGTNTKTRLERCNEAIVNYLQRFNLPNLASSAISSASGAISTALRGMVEAFIESSHSEDNNFDDSLLEGTAEMEDDNEQQVNNDDVSEDDEESKNDDQSFESAIEERENDHDSGDDFQDMEEDEESADPNLYA